jgi:aminoglycoside phosphotransferase (APT) family kinase protein
MESLAIPDTLNHFDMNPANVIVQPVKCKFLDWAEAAVGNPFFSFEYLRQHFLRVFGDQPEAVTKLRKAYGDVWSRLLPELAIHRAMELMPLLAPFAFAATALPWNAVRGEAQSESAGLLRSLARRMHREAEQLRREA